MAIAAIPSSLVRLASNMPQATKVIRESWPASPPSRDMMTEIRGIRMVRLLSWNLWRDQSTIFSTAPEEMRTVIMPPMINSSAKVVPIESIAPVSFTIALQGLTGVFST